jgi:hypothetical protein
VPSILRLTILGNADVFFNAIFQSQISEFIINRVGDVNDARSIDDLRSGEKFLEEFSDFASDIRNMFRTVLCYLL